MNDICIRAAKEQSSRTNVVLEGAAQLQHALCAGDVAKAAALLDFIKGRVFLWQGGLALEAAQAVASACTPALAAGPEVATKACVTLGSSLQLCRQCGGPTSEELVRLDLAPLAAQLVAAMRRHPADTAVQTTGLHLLLCLAGCTSCRLPISPEQQDMLGAAGAVPAAASALALLSTAAVAAGEAHQLATVISEGLCALHYLCSCHFANLEQLAIAGGMQAVGAAMAAASSEWLAEEHGLLLLGQLACRQGAAVEEQQAAAVSIWQAAQLQVDHRLVEVGRAAMWSMARVLQRMLMVPRAANSAAAAQLLAELQQRGAAIVLAMLQSCDKKDDPLMKHCLDFLAVAAMASRQAQPGDEMPPAVAAVLLSREVAAAVLLVAGQATELRTQATALRTLYCLCQAGSCGLTWQQLAAGAAVAADAPAAPEAAAEMEAELLSGASSIAAAIFAVVGATSQAGGKGGIHTSAQDVLAVQLYALACIGALLSAAGGCSPAVAATLVAQLHAEHFAAAQEAVAAACGALGQRPELLAMLDGRQQQQQQEAGAGCVFDLDWSSRCCHLVMWQEPVAWPTAAAAVRGVCALLRCDPEGLNAADKDGCTLLHRLAAAGQARCLELLLSQGGTSVVDLLVRTRGGANALQLARQHRHEACVQLLEAATQAAAEARQAALLKELELDEMDEGSSSHKVDADGKKGKKKKVIARSPSFAAEQQEEKAQKVASGDREVEADEEGGRAKAQQQREREEAYEQALEARRRELAALQAAAAGANGEAARHVQSEGGGEVSSSSQPPWRRSSESSEGRDQPGTPDQQEDQPTTASAQATAAAAAMSRADAAGRGGGSSPEPGEAGFTAGAMLPSLHSSGSQPQPQQQQQQQWLMPPSPFAPAGQDLGRTISAATSMFSDQGSGSLFGSPSLVSSIPGAGASYLPQAAFPLAGSSAFGGTIPAPFPSPTGLVIPRLGLPPLPGRQQSFGTAMTTACAHGGSASTGAMVAVAAAAAADTDHMLSMRLQDALFVGSQSLSSPSPRHQQSPPQRHSLFASLAGCGADEEDAEADSSHLLSSSLSCLDDGPMMGRTSSCSTEGSGSPSLAATVAAQKQLAAVTAADALMNGLWSAPSGSPGSATGAGASASECGTQRVPDLSSDESSEPTRHLWIGNLGTRTPRALLKTLFERFGTVDDVVTFPGRMYAFVNYRCTEEAIQAFQTLQDQQVVELTGDRRLLIKYRPTKKAAVHLRALGLVDEDGVPTESRLEPDRDGNSTEPSPRIWLGNITPAATSKSLHAVLGRFGALTDAAVFPARIGPLGYAFVKFERLEEAMRAFEALNNTVVPPLSGSKQLKMRYKPANDGPAGRGEDPSDPGKAITVPSRHLWLGNITQKPTDEQVLEVFASFGKVDSVRVFPVKAYAFVNYADIGSAIRAMQAVDGLAIPQLTGVKPLVMRYQQESGGSTASTPKPSGSTCSASASLLPHVTSEAALSAALGLDQLVPGSSLASLLGTGAAGTTVPSVTGTATATATSADGSGSDDGLMPVPNLSNKLNPNNVHYDAELAERYKHMNRREKDLMWAADSLLHPAEPGKCMLWTHSMGYLNGAAGTPTAPNGASLAAATTAQAHAAMAVLQQQQQQQGDGAAAAANGSMLTSQVLALHQLAPGQPAPPAQKSQLPTGASASQLTAVLNNLTAMRRTGSMPGSSGAGVSFSQAPVSATHSLPLGSAGGLRLQHLAPGQGSAPLGRPPTYQQQHDYLQQLLLMQQEEQHAPCLASFGGSSGSSLQPAAVGVAASPSHQITRLSSWLANQNLGSAGGSMRVSTPMLTPSLSAGTSLPPKHCAPLAHHPHHHHHSPQASQLSPHQQQVQSLTAALGHLAAQANGHHQHGTGSPSAQPGHGMMLSPTHGHSGNTMAGDTPGGGLPRHFFCPLSHQVMTDPVLAADGVTYEHRAISEWLAYKDVSPVTQMLLPHKALTPNTVLRAGLLDLLRQQVC